MRLIFCKVKKSFKKRGFHVLRDEKRKKTVAETFAKRGWLKYHALNPFQTKKRKNRCIHSFAKLKKNFKKWISRFKRRKTEKTVAASFAKQGWFKKQSFAKLKS